jgi:hypothetical protein
MTVICILSKKIEKKAAAAAAGMSIEILQLL